MQIFTYENYVKYEKFISKNINILREDIVPYNIQKSKKVNNEDDKICRKMLGIKSEASKFINKNLHTNYKPDDIEKYKSSFVTESLENRESDIIYKLKGRNVFFLIEHQTKKDLKMPWRLMEYSMEIIKSAAEYDKIGQKQYKLPLVIPIVLYTGKEKWNIKKDIKEMQEKLDMQKELKFGEYTIDDINEHTEEELLKEKTYLSKFMLIEKYKKGGDLTNCLDKIVKEINTDEYEEEGKDILLIMIGKVLNEKIGRAKARELVKSMKGEKKEMLQILETIREENEDIRQEGRKEGRILGRQEEKVKIIKEMLKRNMPIELISEITHLTQKTIIKISKT